MAKVKTDAVFNAPCETLILYPETGGNMHCFTGVTSCAVLDVLGPPYSAPQGRDCTYYDESPCLDLPGMLFHCSIHCFFFFSPLFLVRKSTTLYVFVC